MIIFITGATGHTAKYFFQRIMRERSNLNFICPLRRESNHKKDQLNSYGLNLDYVECDLNGDIETISEAMQQADIVLHIAGIRYSERIIQAGKLLNMPWFILVHTTGRFSRFKIASSEYIKIEDRIIRENCNTTILRPTLIYGSSGDRNMWRQIRALDANKIFPVIGSGKNLFQPIHAKDLGDAYFEVIKNKSKTFGKQYNLSGSEPIEYIRILRLISNGLSKNIIFVHIPIWFMLVVVQLLSKIPKKIFRCPINYEQVLRMKEDKVFSHKSAKRDFGFNPMNFSDGIKLELDEFMRLQDSN